MASLQSLCQLPCKPLSIFAKRIFIFPSLPFLCFGKFIRAKQTVKKSLVLGVIELGKLECGYGAKNQTDSEERVRKRAAKNC
jgi:hypothetical protein